MVDEGGEVRERVCGDLADTVEEWLMDLSLSISHLPTIAQEAVGNACGVTLVLGSSPELSNQLPEAQILGALQSHPQSRVPLETARLFVLVDRKPLNKGIPLALEPIESYEGFSDSRVADIPGSLKDPFDQSSVSTATSGVPGVLTL